MAMAAGGRWFWESRFLKISVGEICRGINLMTRHRVGWRICCGEVDATANNVPQGQGENRIGYSLVGKAWHLLGQDGASQEVEGVRQKLRRIKQAQQVRQQLRRNTWTDGDRGISRHSVLGYMELPGRRQN